MFNLAQLKYPITFIKGAYERQVYSLRGDGEFGDDFSQLDAIFLLFRFQQQIEY